MVKKKDRYWVVVSTRGEIREAAQWFEVYEEATKHAKTRAQRDDYDYEIFEVNKKGTASPVAASLTFV